MDRAGAQAVVHGASLEKLHDDERRAVVLPDVEHRDDVPLTRELRGGERLPLEAGAHVLVARVALGEHLDGDDAAEHRVGRAVDLAHPPLATREGEVYLGGSRSPAIRPVIPVIPASTAAESPNRR